MQMTGLCPYCFGDGLGLQSVKSSPGDLKVKPGSELKEGALEYAQVPAELLGEKRAHFSVVPVGKARTRREKIPGADWH